MIRNFKRIAEGHNVVLTIKKSILPKPQRRGYLQLCCEQWGSYRGKKSGRVPGGKDRKTNTKLRLCPFMLVAKEVNPGEWVMLCRNGRHNHATPTRYLVGHAYAGRVIDAQTGLVRMLADVGCPPKAMWQSLRVVMEEVPKQFVTSDQTLRNLKESLKKASRGDRTATQDVLYKLDARHYLSAARRRSAQDQTMTDLFMAHPEACHLLSLFPYVIIMDCTYKTKV